MEIRWARTSSILGGPTTPKGASHKRPQDGDIDVLIFFYPKQQQQQQQQQQNYPKQQHQHQQGCYT